MGERGKEKKELGNMVEVWNLGAGKNNQGDFLKQAYLLLTLYHPLSSAHLWPPPAGALQHAANFCQRCSRRKPGRRS